MIYKHITKTIVLILVICCAILVSACEFSAYFTGRDNVEEPPDEQEDNDIVLSLWYIWTADSESNKQPFERTLEAWNQENPHIIIESEATENMVYGTKLSMAVAVNEMPDIFYTWGAGYSSPFVESGKVLALDKYLSEETLSRIREGTLENFIYNGKIYALPIYMTVGVFYCNEDLFSEYQLDLPDTYTDLVQAVKTFRSAGIVPMALGQADRWTGMYYHNILTVRTAGTTLSNAALQGEASFDQLPFVEAAEKLLYLVSIGAFDDDATTMTRDEAEAEFIQGKIPMYYNGNWVAGTLDRDDSPVKGKIIAREFPVIEEYGNDHRGILGGAIDTFMVAQSAQYKAETVYALQNIVENFARESYVSGAMHPAWIVDVDEDKLRPLMLQINQMTENRSDYVIPWSIFLGPTKNEAPSDLVSELFYQTITASEFANKLQKINEN